MPHKYVNDSDDVSPPTPINIKKTATRTIVGVGVTALLTIIALSFKALAISQAENMLKDYQKKDEATAVNAVLTARINHQDEEIEVLKDELRKMDRDVNRKLDHLQDTVDFMQSSKPALSPKGMDQQH